MEDVWIENVCVDGERVCGWRACVWMENVCVDGERVCVDGERVWMESVCVCVWMLAMFIVLSS